MASKARRRHFRDYQLKIISNNLEFDLEHGPGTEKYTYIIN